MDLRILEPEAQAFIRQMTQADVTRLALRANPFPQLEYRDVLQQIESRQKCKTKLPVWYDTPGIYYPPKISVEQSSSEGTASYKSRLVAGSLLCDLTAGMGVDSHAFSKSVANVHSFELNPERAQIAAHNFKCLGAENIRIDSGEGWQGVLNQSLKPDWIYVDPSRRSNVKGKVFLLADCEPNVSELLPDYLERAPRIMIKTSPLLDISAGLSGLKHVAQIHIVALQGEVKELLWVINRGFEGEPEIIAVNLEKSRETVFSFVRDSDVKVQFHAPERFLYEPNAAVMKSGGFAHVGAQFDLAKLHLHSHLYTSSDLKKEFPGRIFNIEAVLPYEKQTMIQRLRGTKANVSVRNFPEDVAFIRKKWKISDGGNTYAFFTTDLNEAKIVLLCSKIESL